VDHQQSWGSDVHYGIVHYGTDPKDLKSIVKKFITPALASESWLASKRD
jgi:hypothetical protein